MKKTVLALSLISSMALAGDYYGGVDFNFAKGSTEYTKDFTGTFDYSQTSFGIHSGYNINTNSQIEFYFRTLKFDYEDNQANTDGNQFGVDYIYKLQLPETSKITPYVGAGFTLNNLNIKLANSDTLDGTGLKLRGGIYYTITEKINFGAELNYNNIWWSDVKFPNGSIAESSSGFYGLGLNVNYEF